MSDQYLTRIKWPDGGVSPLIGPFGNRTMAQTWATDFRRAWKDSYPHLTLAKEQPKVEVTRMVSAEHAAYWIDDRAPKAPVPPQPVREFKFSDQQRNSKLMEFWQTLEPGHQVTLKGAVKGLPHIVIAVGVPYPPGAPGYARDDGWVELLNPRTQGRTTNRLVNLRPVLEAS